jgi:enamine deaminase RidA (YjgF/YER057c/UK114 family)
MGNMAYAQAAGAESKRVLADIDELLQALGVSKSNLLTAKVLLSDPDLFADYDAAWKEWLGAAPAPLRVWKLFAAPGRLVDITVTGLRMRASPSPSPHVQGRPSQG